MMRTICLCGLLVLLLCGACSDKEHDHGGRVPLVEVEGSFLYREDVESACPVQCKGQDSVRWAGRFVRNWVEEELLYAKARENVGSTPQIERLVENYRRSLIVQAYQEELLRQQSPQQMGDSALRAYYESNLDLFKAEHPLVKGLFMKVPLTAPQIAEVRRWYKSDSHEAVEQLEKYSLRNAVVYEYFYDRWVPVSELQDLMPLPDNDLASFLDKNRHVERKDTAYYYFLHVTELLMPGAQEPYDFARPQVENLVRNAGQVEFLKQVKSDLYRRAEQRQMVKYY